ncbi:hypothetical protein [Mucilaginibacter sp. AK015]|uniref:hypothetical protein n=1 Tax=Mucilaginibacter sp. AK015 TaxID=2723072 RepID=UPI00160A032B|nr:hypothetical protein [Mucilaginibacter sp. AK015]MBB5396346.1 plasmid maintenance system killer protein [Mucilaginibacter sp. AK015]
MRTLFVDISTLAYDFKNRYNKTISHEFANCADVQLTALFELKTGIKINKQISIATRPEWEFFTEIGEVSKVAFSIYINHNWNNITVLWKSKSGRVYRLEDTDIDCNDIEFWFDGLDVALIYQQMYPNVKLPFKLKDLSYELIVARINMDCTMQIQLKPEYLSDVESIMGEIDDFIAAFNENSEKKGRTHGVIHNWKPRTESGKLIYDIDLGSTGPYFFKKLLPHLSSMNYFTTVELC